MEHTDYSPPEELDEEIVLEDETEDDGECRLCRGTGEGRYDGAACQACRGVGFVRLLA